VSKADGVPHPVHAACVSIFNPIVLFVLLANLNFQFFCINRRHFWPLQLSTRATGIDSCLPPEPPDNTYIEGGQKPTALGSVVKFRCNKGFQFAGTSAEVVTATCGCSWLWVYDPVTPRCEGTDFIDILKNYLIT
jgi:hypothetical protein